MKLLFCLLLLLTFMNIRHIRGNGIRVPLSIYEHEVNGYDEDVDYYGSISIGTPPQKINVLFSLRHDHIQVLSSYCNSSVCRDQNHSTYNHKISKTFRSEDDFDSKIWKDFVRVNDTITIGGIQIHNASFSVYAKLKEECDSKPCDGIVGLGQYSHLFEHCKQIGLKKKFSFYTNYPWDNNTSELMLCGEDKTKFRGNLQYVTSNGYISQLFGYGVQIERLTAKPFTHYQVSHLQLLAGISLLQEMITSNS
ncbi:uncharacterized protein LOC135837795 isoform X2 [Planococcus citri]|uniref:uncharacterized protein LOC135837795 isoform X2 n=1 Tax=Planococcus citri TaxID=170843 RepID=UPI0031F9A3C4